MTKFRKPRVGDIWEFRVPGKRKQTKEIGQIYRRWINRRDAQGNYIGQLRSVYCAWRRMNKGRYSGLSAKSLLQYGRLISTRAEREAEAEADWNKRPLERRVSRSRLIFALGESVKLQAHYAELLNMHDGGERLIFPTVETWLKRLDKTSPEPKT